MDRWTELRSQERASIAVLRGKNKETNRCGISVQGCIHLLPTAVLQLTQARLPRFFSSHKIITTPQKATVSSVNQNKISHHQMKWQCIREARSVNHGQCA